MCKTWNFFIATEFACSLYFSTKIILYFLHLKLEKLNNLIQNGTLCIKLPVILFSYIFTWQSTRPCTLYGKFLYLGPHIPYESVAWRQAWDRFRRTVKMTCDRCLGCRVWNMLPDMLSAFGFSLRWIVLLWRIDPLLGKDLEVNEYSRCYAIGK
jgi:hypothetical protein